MIALLVCARVGGGGASGGGASGGGGTQEVAINGRTFELELALDAAARHQGLSDRESIAADGGMLFVFRDDAERVFVMRRCLVPIDIIFLSGGGRVLNTHAMQVEPPGTPEHRLRQYESGGKAAFVIELAGGTLETLAVQPGQRIELPYLELKRKAR